MKRTVVPLLIFILAVPRILSAGQTLNDGHWNAVLQKYVRNGRVNYQSLLKNQSDLDAFLDQAAAVSKAEYRAWTRNQQEAFTINLYNASTLRLILDHYPVKSIRDIGHVWQGPWDQPMVRLWGKTTTLHFLENEVLRKIGDPRVHFAINCASKGCPKLQSQAYEPETLDAQLDQSAREFLANAAKNRFDAANHSITLSPVFKWYQGDFAAKAGSVRAFIIPFLPPKQAALTRDPSVSIHYSAYDWSLNNQTGAKP